MQTSKNLLCVTAHRQFVVHTGSYVSGLTVTQDKGSSRSKQYGLQFHLTIWQSWDTNHLTAFSHWQRHSNDTTYQSITGHNRQFSALGPATPSWLHHSLPLLFLLQLLLILRIHSQTWCNLSRYLTNLSSFLDCIMSKENANVWWQSTLCNKFCLTVSSHMNDSQLDDFLVRLVKD